jgi:predicted RNase H-like HicB family nuclease
MKKFTLEYWKDDDWFVGRLVEVPGVFSQGETLDELKGNIGDAYRMMVESEPLDILPVRLGWGQIFTLDKAYVKRPDSRIC